MVQNRVVTDSSVATVALAEEQTPKNLPGSPSWFNYRATAFGAFGLGVDTVQEETFNEGRQAQEQIAVGISSQANFTINPRVDFKRHMQGMVYANASEQFALKPLNGTQTNLTSIALSGVYNGTWANNTFTVGNLVLVSGNTESANNGFGRVTAQGANNVTIAGPTTVVESSPSAAANILVVGHRFAADDVAYTLSGGRMRLASTANAFAGFVLPVGSWIFIGGTPSANRFASGYGYGRVRSKTNGLIILDDVAWTGGTIADDTGSGKSIELYFGTSNINQNTRTNIICRSYTVERALGQDTNGTQHEYAIGQFMNTLTFGVPTKQIHSAEIGMVGLDYDTRTGLEGPLSGTHTTLGTADQPFDTSGALFRGKMAILDDSTVEPTDLFAFFSEANITINNNVSVVEAVGEQGGIDVSLGLFNAAGEFTAYFRDVNALDAIRNSRRVGLNLILAQHNRGVIYDIPLVGISTEGLSLTLNEPITIPLSAAGAENPQGYTFAHITFDYLPDIAMPNAVAP